MHCVRVLSKYNRASLNVKAKGLNTQNLSTIMLFDIFEEDNKTGTAGIDIQYLWPYSFSGPR